MLPAPVANLLGRLTSADRRGYRRISRLGADSDNRWIAKSSTIDGWLFEGEHACLWDLATESNNGDIVEIGSWMGKSACIFAGACIDHAPETRVYCVDPFTMLGSPSQEAYHKRITKGDGTFYQFAHNAGVLGYYKQIVPLATTSDLALPAIPDGCRLAFVDARHDYEGVSTDTQLVLPKIRPGGLLALHDSGVYQGVDQHIEQDLKRDTRLTFVRQVHSIVVFRKNGG
jgi:Methyltransferase domain